MCEPDEYTNLLNPTTRLYEIVFETSTYSADTSTGNVEFELQYPVGVLKNMCNTETSNNNFEFCCVVKSSTLNLDFQLNILQILLTLPKFGFRSEIKQVSLCDYSLYYFLILLPFIVCYSGQAILLVQE